MGSLRSHATGNYLQWVGYRQATALCAKIYCQYSSHNFAQRKDLKAKFEAGMETLLSYSVNFEL